MSHESMSIERDWTFKKADVANAFDNHVREQLPWYDLTTGVTAHIARHYISQGGNVYDIGASTGNIGKALAETVGQRKANFIAIDDSKEMQNIYQGPGSFICADACDVNYEKFDVAILFLTLMFIHPEKRKELLERLIKKCRTGGAIIIFDKMEADAGYLATIKWRLTLAGKIAANVPSEQIVAKEMSLGGIQRPLRKGELPDNAVEVFRFGDFGGWVIEA
jgi:tRNA (cmo5U34)-methyltransferase